MKIKPQFTLKMKGFYWAWPTQEAMDLQLANRARRVARHAAKLAASNAQARA